MLQYEGDWRIQQSVLCVLMLCNAAQVGCLISGTLQLMLLKMKLSLERHTIALAPLQADKQQTL